MDLESFLAHHGIKGMRWGVRRSDKQLHGSHGDSNSSHRSAPKVHKDFKQIEDLMKRPRSSLSNEQLKKIQERHNLETNFLKLKEGQPPKHTPNRAEDAYLRSLKPHQLSDEQLKRVNERVQAEKKFRELNPSKWRRGAAYVEQALAVGAVIVTVHELSKNKQFKELVKNGAEYVRKVA